ncbi:MAG TPA: hypothetical protein VGA95_02565 [Thermodesulfobacteriota bacterium]
MTELILVPAEQKYVEEIGRICFESFRELHDRHFFPRDFPTAFHQIRNSSFVLYVRPVSTEGFLRRAVGRSK